MHCYSSDTTGFFFFIIVELSSRGLCCFVAIKDAIVFAIVKATHEALFQKLLYLSIHSGLSHTKRNNCLNARLCTFPTLH